MIDIRKSNKLKHDSVFHRHFYLLLSLLLSPSFSFHLQLPQLVSFFFLPVPISFLLHFTSPPISQLTAYHLHFHPLFFHSLLVFPSFYSFSFIPFFYCQLLPHFFHSHLFFHNQFCSYPLFPYFIPYSSLFLPLKFFCPTPITSPGKLQ